MESPGTNGWNKSETSGNKIYPWVVVGLLWGVALLNYMDRQMLSTMKEAMEMDIEALQSAENFGFLMAIFLYIYGFMSPVAGSILTNVLQAVENQACNPKSFILISNL